MRGLLPLGCGEGPYWLRMLQFGTQFKRNQADLGECVLAGNRRPSPVPVFHPSLYRALFLNSECSYVSWYKSPCN